MFFHVLIIFFSKQKIKGEEKTCKKCEMRRAGQDVTPDIRHIRSCPDKHLEKKTYSKKCEYCDKIIVMNMKRQEQINYRTDILHNLINICLEVKDYEISFETELW